MSSPEQNPQATTPSFADHLRPGAEDSWLVGLEWVEEFREWMHAHPELSGAEENTAAAIAEKLAQFDCEVTTGIGGHGITAVFRNGEGPTVLMRADFDALPVTETTGLSYTSTVEGVMHACGHDVHTASLLGLCAIMDAHRSAWAGTFIALFQPAEEITAGAQAMVNDGLAAKIPTPEVCLGQHIVPGPVGRVFSAPGPVLAACDTITITLHGKSAHGSAPHESIDPTYLAAMIVVRLQGIVGREVPPDEFAVITVGTLSAGHTNNTIPQTATLVLNCRFYNTDQRDRVYRAIERVVRGECVASGVSADPEIEYSAHGELTDNDEGVFARVRPTFDAVFGSESVDAERWTASEDFSEIPRHFGVPYLFWTVGITDQDLWGSGADVPGNHSGDFAPAPGSVEAGIRAAACGVLAYLGV
ncbi:amidohydrolase [Corynebacterium heidelbergense]|uniref:Amidohydrolase n=1 Tax=Corynebacterium heidelbergense TaxID=2055947 RepID=A0A364VAA9_9CORY|nr:amidohydrolase [Corynebacterium heidelbergense]RAV33548.1 amidohydrolase [Corynebacterium heidelbergense]WCZ36422.1 putative hydrolase YxeP [Corynebacterium heidelbergense]